MATTTTWGPTNELGPNPHFAAPGGNIFSTYPLALGEWAVLTGTSMATPYITGVVAIYLSSKGYTTPDILKGRLSSTASPVDWWDGVNTVEGLIAPGVQQGGGLINALRAFTATTEIQPAFISLNVSFHSVRKTNLKDTTHFNAEHIITISNTGNETVYYYVGGTTAATVYTLSSNVTGIPSLFPPVIDNSSLISVSICPLCLQLGPQSSGNISVLFQLASDIDKSLVPVYSGYILIQSSSVADGGTLQVPFMGVAANMTTLRLFNTANGFPTLRSFATTDNRTITSNGTVFSLNTQDIPAVAVELLLPTRVLRLDVLPGDNSTFNTTVFAGLNILG